MYVVSVGKLSDTQKSKLRNGHSSRIKKGSGNQLHLTNKQLKKINTAANKGKAYTVTLNSEQAEKHGAGIFGDIATKCKKLVIKHKDVLNPMIAGLTTGTKRGNKKLAEAAQDKIIEYAQKAQDNIDSKINNVEGGAVRRRRDRPKKGEGFGALLGPLIKLAAPVVIDAVAGAAKNKMSGKAYKKRWWCSNASRDKKNRSKSRKTKKKRSGGVLMPA